MYVSKRQLQTKKNYDTQKNVTIMSRTVSIYKRNFYSDI